MRRIRLSRSISNGDDDPRVREAVLRTENTWLRDENTRLTLQVEKYRQMYSAARAGLRDATGCETPSPAAQTLAARQMEEEHRREQTPQQRASESIVARDQEGRIVDIHEHHISDREMAALRRDMWWDTRIKIIVVILILGAIALTFWLSSVIVQDWFRSW